MKILNYTKIIFTFLALFYPAIAFGQQEAIPFSAKNSLYVELGGNGILYSLNYERIFYQKGSFKTAGRLGFSLVPYSITNKTYWGPVVPLEIIGLVGRNKNHFEFGVGHTLSYSPKSYINLQTIEWDFDKYVMNSLVTARLGYRYQKPDGGLVFRIGYTPILEFSSQREKPYIHWLYGGISIGKSF